MDRMSIKQEPFISWFHRSGRPSGVSWWGERPLWVRHATYWAFALGLLALSVFDDETREISNANAALENLAWIVILILVMAVVCFIYTLKEWEDVGVLRTLSRSLFLFTVLLGLGAIVLFYASSRGGPEINACHVVESQEVCQSQASPREVLGMLAWYAADVVPVLDIPDSFAWERPARSESGLVGGTILLVRLWVAIGVLGIIKRIWDKWESAEFRDRKPVGQPMAEISQTSGAKDEQVVASHAD
jgi:hypothetical protein